MATKSKEPSESERIREVMRLLQRAIDDCAAYLAEAEEAVRQSHQDNDPLR